MDGLERIALGPARRPRQRGVRCCASPGRISCCHRLVGPSGDRVGHRRGAAVSTARDAVRRRRVADEPRVVRAGRPYDRHDHAAIRSAGRRRWRPRRLPASSSSHVFGLAWSRDGAWIATTDSVEPSVRIWSPRTCALVAEIPQPARVVTLAVSPTGQLAAGGVNTMWLWDVPRQHLDATIDHLPGGVVAIDFAPPVIGCSRQPTTSTHSRSPPSSSQLRMLARRSTPATGLSPGSRSTLPRERLLASSFDQYLRSGISKTGALIAKLEGTGALFGVRLSSDGKLIVAVGGSSPTVWDAANLSRVGSLEGHSDQVVRGRSSAIASS